MVHTVEHPSSSGRPEREAVWCVCASHGEYSDRSEWTVAVRRTEADAQAFVDTFATAVQQIKPYVDRGGEDGWWERENRWLKATWRKIARALGDADAFDPTTCYKPADVTLYVAGPFKLPPRGTEGAERCGDDQRPAEVHDAPPQG